MLTSDTEIFIDNDLTYSDIITPETNNGLKLSYETDTEFLAISLQDGAFFGDGRLGSDTDSDTTADLVAQLTGSLDPELSGYALEAAYAKDLGNGFNALIGAVFETTEVETVLMTSKLNQLQSMPSLPMKQVLGCLLVNTT